MATAKQKQIFLRTKLRVATIMQSRFSTEFGFSKTCYCGGQPLLATSYTRNDSGSRYFTCENLDDRECHVWKWWDVAVMEEMRARDTHYDQVAEKIDYLTFLSNYETQLNQV